MYDAILTNSQPPPQSPQPPDNTTENKEQTSVLVPNKPAKTKKKTGLLMLALLPVLGAIVASRVNITPASDPLPSSSNQGQQTENNPQIAEAKSPNSAGANEGDGLDLDALINAINQSKNDAKQSITIARENLDYSMVSLMLFQMREANKAPRYTPPDRWWLMKAQEKAEQFKNRTANLGDFTTYKGIKNWQTWLTEVNALLVIHDLLIESGKGNQLQIVPNPNLAVSLSQYLRFTELAIAGDTQTLEQMRAQAEAQKNADKYNKEVKTNYDKSITNSH